MGIEGIKKITAEEQIAKMRNDLAGKRAARTGALPEKNFIVENIDAKEVDTKISLGTEKVDVNDFEVLTFTTQSNNTYVLQRESAGYSLKNMRDGKTVNIDSAQMASLSVQCGAPFKYSEHSKTTMVVSGEGVLLKK